MIRLLALDMDGTLLRDDKTISERTLAALDLARSRGAQLLLSTGRPLAGVGRYLSQLGMEAGGDFAVCANGAATYCLGAGPVDLCIPGPEDYQWLWKWASAVGANLQFLTETALYTMVRDDYPAKEAGYNGLPLVELSGKPPWRREPVLKAMCIDRPGRIERLRPLLPPEVRRRFQYVESGPFYLEFLHPEAGKVRGIRRVMELTGVAREEVAAFGDAGNDVDMLRFAGLGVAMGNAQPQVRAAARRVAPSNQEDGVAQVLEELYKQEGRN